MEIGVVFRRNAYKIQTAKTIEAVPALREIGAKAAKVLTASMTGGGVGE